MARYQTAVICTYARGVPASLSFRTADSEVEYTIRGDCIIGVLPTTIGSQAHTVFYAYRPEESKEYDAKECPELGRLAVEAAPAELLDDFGIASEGAWWMGDTQLDVIVSTKSGACLAQSFWEKFLQPLLEDLKIKYKVHSTTSADTIKQLTSTTFLPKGQNGEAQKLVLLSGDGGIVDLLNGLLDSPAAVNRSENFRKPQIALLPLGTANALANSSGISVDRTCGTSVLFRGQPYTLPYFKATFSGAALFNPDSDTITAYPLKSMHGAVVLSWGLHAALVADSDTPAYRKHGVERFKMAAQENLFPPDGSLPHSYHGKVFVQPADKTGEQAIPRSTHAYVLITPLSQLDRGFTISPESKQLEPLLRIVHFDMPASDGPEKLPGHKIMEVMMGAYDGGKHVQNSTIGYEAIKSVKIEFDEDELRWRRACIDGMIVVIEKGGWLQMELAEDFEHGSSGILDLVVVSNK